MIGILSDDDSFYTIKRSMIKRSENLILWRIDRLRFVFVIYEAEKLDIIIFFELV